MTEIRAPEGYVPIGQEDTFLGHVGGITWKRRADRTDTCLLLAPHHLNPNGTAHGGFLLTLLDITLGATVESFLGVAADRHPVTLQLSCSMLAPARGGELLFGEAAVDRATRTVTFVSARLHSRGQTVLTASAVFRNPPSSTVAERS
ncbi:PaaI family thioesterase [Pseudonocardia cypriaca]|uniref:Acyl-coenzyme A thioesterase PaaI-like protein n=1 Tax=Pseudonocardia cypriaca TaxID=882449 RepID=A0A543FT74_9PSEU|nr:PaaI family thioesterase [Pseudonocardia cypriaca]TQM37021.1 acyl-coenzyme A thioesterase PaaI-like protein [Pseudonocardia cypriaca]